jgi:hypothetical protein
MKNKNTFFRRLLVFLMLACPMSVYSQSEIFESDQRSEYSIIRNYKPGVDITFSDYYGTEIRFSYVDRNTMTTLSLDVGYCFHVADFVVFDDSVFFCGTGRNGAACGYFDINDVFFNNGPIFYFDLYVPTLYDPDANLLFGMGKIDVMRTSEGETHLLMTGTGYNYDPYMVVADPSQYYPSTIVDFWNAPADGHQFTYTVDCDYVYFYDDVAITEKYGVISARSTNKVGARTHNVFFYKNPTSSGDSFLKSWTVGGNTSNTPFLTADAISLEVSNLGYVRVTKMEGGDFATVCQNYRNDNLTVSMYNDPYNSPYARFELPYDYFLTDLVYNTSSKTLFCLAGYSHLLQIMYPYTYCKDEKRSPCRWLSLDNADSDSGEILSGFELYNGYAMKYWYHDPGNQSPSCFEYDDRENIELGKVDRLDYYTQEINDQRSTVNTCGMKHFEYIIWPVCTGSRK